MKIKHFTDVPSLNPFAGKVGANGGISMRNVINAEDGAANFDMRVLEFEPGGHTSFHEHVWEHEIFILDGRGAVVLEGLEQGFKKGDAVFIEQSEKHQIKNTGEELLRLICCIPQIKN